MIKRTILTVIILSMLVVILAFFFNFLMNPERIAKQDLETISRDYYEDYLYETIVNTNLIGETSEKKSLEEIMTKYVESGFAKVTLRQLLLMNEKEYSNLSTYCDENETYVRFFPIAPFKKTDYRIEYNYSCIF